MKRFQFTSLGLLILACLILIACSNAAPPSSPPENPTPSQAAPKPSATKESSSTKKPKPSATKESSSTKKPPVKDKTKKVLIGFTSSQTGQYKMESERQINGIKLWIKEVNKDGGISLDDGSKIVFEVKNYDDKGDKDRVQELYTHLISENQVDFLISPYSSELTEVAAAVADQNKKLMLTAGAADDAIYKNGLKFIYQVYTPASRYLKGAIDLIADLKVAKIAFVYEKDSFSTSVVEAAKKYAEVKQYEIVLSEGYDTGIIDFSSLINQIQQAEPDIVLGGGHFEDGSRLVRQLREQKVAVNLLGLLIAPTDSSFAKLGDAAFGVIGPSQWEPKTNFSAKDAEELGVEWYGPTNEAFVKAYKAAYKGQEPSYHAAGGYMAGLILQYAIEQAGTLDTQKVKTALDKTDFLSFYGRINFDDSAEAHGLQTGHKMVYVQWQHDSKNKLIKQIIWPEAGKTAEIIYPLP